MQTIRWAIEDGHQAYDFLRGDEHYKSQWRAEPTGMFAVRVVRQRATSQLREAAYQAAGNFRNWLSASWRMVRETTPGAYTS
jgi:CelD/BcsL family acetyltransferase involved in cellulose biosynthesis